MTISRLDLRTALFVLALFFPVWNQNTHAQKKNSYACKEPDPTALLYRS